MAAQQGRLGWKNPGKARLDGEHDCPEQALPGGWTVTRPGCSLTHPFLWPAARVTQLIRGFGSSWKASVESLSQDVMRSFTNFRNGTSIIQVTGHSQPSLHLCPMVVSPCSFPGLCSTRTIALRASEQLCLRPWRALTGPVTVSLTPLCSAQGALTQLIQLYHRFHRVLSQPQLRALPARAELINIHHLMVELKKHKPNF